MLPEPPVYNKPCIPFDTRQSDYFVYSVYCVYFVLLLNYLLLIQPLATPCLTLVWPLSDSSLWRPFWNYRIYLLIVWVGATHKLKPSPTCYPLLIICWPPPIWLWTSTLVLLRNWLLTRGAAIWAQIWKLLKFYPEPVPTAFQCSIVQWP